MLMQSDTDIPLDHTDAIIENLLAYQQALIDAQPKRPVLPVAGLSRIAPRKQKVHHIWYIAIFSALLFPFLYFAFYPGVAHVACFFSPMFLVVGCMERCFRFRTALVMLYSFIIGIFASALFLDYLI